MSKILLFASILILNTLLAKGPENQLRLKIGNRSFVLDREKKLFKVDSEKGLVILGSVIPAIEEVLLELKGQKVEMYGPCFMLLEQGKLLDMEYSVLKEKSIELKKYSKLFSMSKAKVSKEEINELSQVCRRLYSAILTVDLDEIDNIVTWFDNKMTPVQGSLFAYILTILRMTFRHVTLAEVSDNFVKKVMNEESKYTALCMPAVDSQGINFSKGEILLFKESERKGMAKMLGILRQVLKPKENPKKCMELLGFDQNTIPLPYVSTSPNSAKHLLQNQNSKVNVFYSKDGKAEKGRYRFNEVFEKIES